MDYNSIALLHKTDPAIVALRKDWLHLAFKRKPKVRLSQDIFREQLDAYLEHINSTLAENARYRHGPDYYIDRWSREDDLISIRTRDDGYVIQLSPHADRLIGWFEDRQSQHMIGTESRLLNILSLIDELVTRGTSSIASQMKAFFHWFGETNTTIFRTN